MSALPPSQRRDSPAPLLCFDFDGTLVDKEFEPAFDPELARVLDEMGRRGARWVINSGRSLAHVLDGIVDYRISAEPDFIIAREHEIFARDSSGDWIDCGDWNRHWRERHRRFYQSHRRFLAEVRSFIEIERHASWIEDALDPAGLIAASESAMVEIVAFVDARLAHNPEVVYHRNSIYLRFTHRDCDKGSALKELGTQLGIDAGRIFAAGDNYNDQSMLRRSVAAALCCPANALPEVKEQVSREGGFVSGERASRGMLEGLRHYFSGDRFPAQTTGG